MTDKWEEALACAITCTRCNQTLKASDERILSIYDHEPICLACKREEEQRPDYKEKSKQAIGECLADTEALYSDPGGYCYHHFYPYKC